MNTNEITNETVAFTTDADDLRLNLNGGGYPSDWLTTDSTFFSDEIRSWAVEHVEAVNEVLEADDADVRIVLDVLDTMRKQDFDYFIEETLEVVSGAGYNLCTLSITDNQCVVKIAADDFDFDQNRADLDATVVDDITAGVEDVLAEFDVKSLDVVVVEVV